MDVDYTEEQRRQRDEIRAAPEQEMAHLATFVPGEKSGGTTR
jgi:hypothetical protein